MKFVIRDDDLNYFSTPEDVERWYGDLFAEGISVGFAAIPYVKPSSDVYIGTSSVGNEECAISTNTELVAYVKQSPHIDILQHGTTHETVDGQFEYARAVPRTEAQRGRSELERAFGRPVSVFVPPHDWIGKEGILSIEEAHMNVIRGRGAGLRNLILRWQYVAIFMRMMIYKSMHVPFGKVPAYPHVLDFGKHKEVCSYRLEDTDVFEGLRYAHKHDGIFVVVAHVHTYTQKKKERLMRLISEARSLGAEFTAPSALFTLTLS